MSNLSTHIARITDSMILVATMDSGVEASSSSSASMQDYKMAAKKIIKTLKPHSPARCTIDAGASSAYLFHYILESSCIFLTLCEKNYPKKLAYTYLNEVHKEFTSIFPPQTIAQFSRPYEAISFEPKLTKIRREFLDPNSRQNLQKLNAQLDDIHNIMSSSITSLLSRGEKLDTMETRSGTLLAESKKFSKMGRAINLQALLKTYAPIVAIVLFVLFVLYVRFWWY